MSMVICSLENLKKVHEETKKYECYANLVSEQEVILKEIKKALVDKEQDDVCIDYFEYDSFKRAIKPEDLVADIINKFGEKLVFNILKENYNLK